MGSLPLLHIAESRVAVTTLDWRIVALAVALFAAWLAVTLKPWRVRRRMTMQAARLAAAGLLFLAVLPSVLPYDHLLPHDEHDERPGATAVHASHCHDTPGSCADAPLPAGPGQLLSNSPLLPSPALLAVLMGVCLTALVGLTMRPELRPPLAAALRATTS
jgi:hypothetical protein